MFGLAAPLLAAQQATSQAGTAPGDLDTELHFTAGSGAWLSANKPAYLALFDVSRSSVTQIYPEFSAQAQFPTGGNHLVVDVPYAELFGGWGSLVGLHAARLQDSGWPHTLLLVASTSPLRVSSPWTTELTLNHELLREHHVTDLQTDGGIESLVDLVKPADPDAEMAFDRLDNFNGAVASYASGSVINPSGTSYLGYMCMTPGQQGSSFFSMVALAGNECSVVTPARQGVTAIMTPHGEVDAAAAARAVGQSLAITDPAAIERFIDGYRGGHYFGVSGKSDYGTAAPSGSTLWFDHGGMQAGGATIGTVGGAAIAPPSGPAAMSPASVGGARISKP